MGHRIYDPRLTRFLQADPLIEDGSTLNRYTYVHNDPLAYTDPSGYLSFRQFVRTAVAVGISVWSGGALAGAAWAGVGTTISSAGFMTKLAFAMSNGLLAGAIQSGTVEGAAWGAFSAGVFFGIGQGLAGAGQWAEGSFMGTKLSGAGFAVKTVSHGLAGGTISHLQGGKFGHGFASAAGSAATAPLVDASSANVVRGAVVTTLVGGTLSRLSGGNFANGALTAAMSYAFASALSKGNQSPLGQKQVGDEPDNVSDVVRVNRAFRDNINVSCSEQHCDVSMRFTIGGDRTVTDWLVSWAADDIRRTWEGGYVYGGAHIPCLGQHGHC